jgi:hypothetical protein
MRELKPERKLALLANYDGAGFQAFLDVMENITLDAEDALIGELPGDDKTVLALHAIAHAHRVMLTTVANQIDVLVAESREGEKKDTMERRKVKLSD